MGDKPAIGFIGVGPMGHGMAKNILAGGYPLYVKGNRDRTPVDDLVSRGAVEAQSPAAMAQACEIVFLCLPNSVQVEAAIRGPDGVLSAAKPGLIVVDCTTADPVSTVALAAEMTAAGMSFCDAPLGGTPKQAEAGALGAMVGADEATFEAIRPVIEQWAGTIAHIGPVGAGHKMKLLMNFTGMAYGALYSELLTLGVKVGIAPQTIREILGPSRMGCGFFETFMAGAVGREPEAHVFSIANAAKDIRYVNNMANDAGALTVMAAAARQYYA